MFIILELMKLTLSDVKVQQFPSRTKPNQTCCILVHAPSLPSWQRFDSEFTVLAQPRMCLGESGGQQTLKNRVI